jgi:hypothetical protein
LKPEAQLGEEDEHGVGELDAAGLIAVAATLGRAKIESPVRYLGIEVDDALTLSEQVEL